MNAYVVLIGSEEKVGQTEPTILGPFNSGDAAWAWVTDHAAELERWRDLEDGGWPTAHVICDATADSPEAWLAEYAVDDDDDGGPVDTNSLAYKLGQEAGARAEIPERP